eukprot:CAMPEP_0194346338 /NCGR_PEP_ID=MMETSP0171-20130528/105369_1 /TAXON_ID=218684 /ORGANISM="Corethron pennatum, Strain L29A3" /LENGTH=883 /DNA_ID=CAMNT_0039113447 /DNA_START=66 /DNA_END=2718 /DNA_ORIENTATION=+
MRFSVAFLIASVAVSSIGVRGSNSLTRDEFDSVIKTMATSDFGLEFSTSAIGPATTESTFSSTLAAQWHTNAQQPEETAPYLVCETTPGLSGYARAVRIATRCNRTGFGRDVVQNLAERTCFDDQLVPAAARACADGDEDIHVVPYSAWHKISAASFLGSLQQASDGVGAARYAGTFCRDPLSDVSTHFDVAHRALQRTFDDNADCVGSLMTVGGRGAALIDLFRLTAQDSRLLLHQTAGTPALPVGCVVSLVESLASHPFVCTVEHDPPVRTLNQQARWIIQGSVYGDDGSMELPLHRAGLRGENQVAQISDTGVSVNSCYFYDRDGEVVRDRSATVDATRRKVIQYYARVSAEDEHGHGSHCAGTILGKVCPYDDDGCKTSSNMDGTAPEAKIAVYDIGNNEILAPEWADPMFVRGMAAGATVHSASWGNELNYYQEHDKDYDKFQYQNDQFLVVFAAGNSGEDNAQNTVSSVAKNNLNVCASRNKDRGLGELYVATFSSMGPSADGRIKPDICAPGHWIGSAAKGLARQCNYVNLAGSSMACPGVAGAALLVRQYFVDGFSPSGTKVPADGFEPSGALVKAVILNSGRLMLGRDNSDNNRPVFPSTEFDGSQGFGLISLVDGLYLHDTSQVKVRVWDRERLTNGQAWTMSFTLGTCPAAHTSVTLTYFDKENNNRGCNPCRVNRLDLTVDKDGVTSYPNGGTGADEKNNSQRVRLPHVAGDVLTVNNNGCNPCRVNHLDLTVDKDGVPSYPNGGTGADEKNNSQRVRLPHVAGDVLTVTVRAANLATATQKFALVVSGCIESQHDTLIACKEEGTDKYEKRLASNKKENRARKKLCPKTPQLERKSCMKKYRDELREQNKVAKKVLRKDHRICQRFYEEE